MKIPDSRPRFLPSDRDAAPADSTVKRGRYALRGRIWIEGGDGTFLGYGRAELLERIERFGSISQAARSMNMSYRHAWELVDSINRQAKSPLVETSVGGRKGGRPAHGKGQEGGREIPRPLRGVPGIPAERGRGVGPLMNLPFSLNVLMDRTPVRS